MRLLKRKNGEQALELFEKQKPKLILLDVLMPGIDGYETCKKIRQSPSGGYLPIVMMTSLDDEASIETAYEVGATDFLTKPINCFIIGQRIRYLLRSQAIFAALHVSERRLAKAQRLARLGHWEMDLETKTLFFSDQFNEILGTAKGTQPKNLQFLIDRVPEDERSHVKEKITEAVTLRRPVTIEHQLALSNDQMGIVYQEIDYFRDPESGRNRLMGVVQDITAKKKTEREIQLLRYIDQLTGLPNRGFVDEKLSVLLNWSKNQNQKLALIVIDLDKFGKINENLGHSFGDQLLKSLSRRLIKSFHDFHLMEQASFPEYWKDALALSPVVGVPIFRSGGDEFKVILPHLNHLKDAGRFAKIFKGKLEAPFLLDGKEVFITASLGIALFPQDGENLDLLRQNARVALSQAKKAGGNCFRFHSEEHNISIKRKFELESQFRKGLEKREFSLVYQPKINILDGSVTGFEALSRWHHPHLGTIPPNQFIPLAEETGLIYDFGRWTIRQACRQHFLWCDQGLPSLPIAINLSGLQFNDANLVPDIQNFLHTMEINPSILELELTESTLMDNPAKSTERLKALKDMGLTLTLDDFGTGYSSMSYLKQFPIDIIKIDRSFIEDATQDRKSAAIVKSIIELAENLDMDVVAEGVSEAEQIPFLKKVGCTVVQGFYYCKPTKPEEIPMWLQDRTQVLQ